jgi:hypothetical protein
VVGVVLAFVDLGWKREYKPKENFPCRVAVEHYNFNLLAGKPNTIASGTAG